MRSNSRKNALRRTPQARAKERAYRRTRRKDPVARPLIRALKRKYDQSPRGRFRQQKRHAAQRSIEWLLTFEQWWSLWEPYWDRRGRCAECHVMARYGDKGAYVIGNVKIVTASANASEIKRNKGAKL